MPSTSPRNQKTWKAARRTSKKARRRNGPVHSVATLGSALALLIFPLIILYEQTFATYFGSAVSQLGARTEPEGCPSAIRARTRDGRQSTRRPATQRASRPPPTGLSGKTATTATPLNQVNLRKLEIFRHQEKCLAMFLLTIILSISLLSAQTVSHSNHLIYDNIGSLATRVTHIHVAIPLNISALLEHINLFSSYLTPMLSHKHPTLNVTPAHLQTRAFNNVIESLADMSLEKLILLKDKLHSIQALMPEDNSADISGPRHKRASVLSEAPLIRHKRLTYYQETVQLKLKLRHAQDKIDRLTTEMNKPKTFPSPYGPLPENYFSSIPDYHSYPSYRHQTNDTLHREKRQLLLVAAAISGVVGTFMGLFNQGEIHAINNHLAQIDKTDNMLVHIAQQHEHRIQHLSADLTDLTKVLDQFFLYNPTLLQARLDRQIDIISERIDIVIDTVQHLQHHRLSIRLLSAKQIEILHTNVQTSAAASNLTPLPQHLQDYFQLETSYIHSAHQILILIHVPCSSIDNIFTI